MKEGVWRGQETPRRGQVSPSAWDSEHRLPQPLTFLPVWSWITAHSQAWKGQTPWTRLVSTEEAPTAGLAGPVDSSQVRTCQPCSRLSRAGRSRELYPQGKQRVLGTVRVRALTSWESSSRTQTGQHPPSPPTHTPRISSRVISSPGPACPVGLGTAGVPGAGRRMQLSGGPQGPGETEPVLKRQGGWLPGLGRFPGMTVPGGMAPLSQGSRHPKPRSRCQLSLELV